MPRATSRSCSAPRTAVRLRAGRVASVGGLRSGRRCAILGRTNIR
ncbi:hypothetical protein ACFPM0_04785 [Pseudonocardia sulfidoxydans]